MSNYEFSNLACWGESQREEAESETSGRGAVQNSQPCLPEGRGGLKYCTLDISQCMLSGGKVLICEKIKKFILGLKKVLIFEKIKNSLFDIFNQTGHKSSFWQLVWSLTTAAQQATCILHSSNDLPICVVT